VSVRPATFLTVRAANGLEVPYSGLIVVDLVVFGCAVNCVPVLVVRDPTGPAAASRKQQIPALLGMNVLGKCKSFPSSLQPALQEAKQRQRCVRGRARVAEQQHLPAYSMTTVRVTGPRDQNCSLMAAPLGQPLPGGLVVVPTLLEGDSKHRFVRMANLSPEDVLLPARTPVAWLHAVDGIEEDEAVQVTVSCSEVTITPKSAESTPTADVPKVPLPATFDGTHEQRRQLQDLLTRYGHVFSQGDDDMGYTDVVQHRIPTTDSVPVAQPYRSIPPNHLQELEHLLQRIAQLGLKLKREKCQFLRRQVTYLGHTISADGVSCDDDKVEQ
ncbi:hypothetical protein BaRGS_00030691, partial [Batillaria attramentaria]